MRKMKASSLAALVLLATKRTAFQAADEK